MKNEYSKYYRIIYIFFIVFVIFNLLSKYLYPVLSLSFERLLVEWILRFCGDIFLSLAIAGLIIIGIFELRIYGFSFKKILSAFVGIMMAIGMIFAMWIIEYNVNSLAGMDGTNYLVQIESKLKDHNLSVTRREKLSKMYAEMYYLQYGEKIKYFKDNKYITYQSTKENDENVALMHKIEREMTSIRRARYFWILLLLFVSIAIGLFLPIRRSTSKE
jgi:uncharacterized protein YxeA